MIKDRLVGELLTRELARQRRGVELIASENFASLDVIRTMGSWLNNKYAEGYPGKRYYGGCEVIDEIEGLAIQSLCKLFGAGYANVQPHAGAQANMAVQLSLLKPGDAILGLNLAHGGHLTHGSPVNFSGMYFRAHSYGVHPDTGYVNMEQVREQALEHRPKLIICGASAYSRDWDYAAFRTIADECGAVLMADIAHPAGLIAAGLLSDPLKQCHVVTSTTHKTLRGPRGGIIIMGEDIPHPSGQTDKKGNPVMMGQRLNSAVFPGTQGGPLEHVIAAKAVAFREAQTEDYRKYAAQVIRNAAALAQALVDRGFNIVSGGTDNHLMLVDLRSKSITGKDAENLLIRADITTNKNMIPNDPEKPMITSGIRLGTAALTTRGLVEGDFVRIAEWIHALILHRSEDAVIASIKSEINRYMEGFPLYPGIEGL
ncbi:MAG: serine hydroxymethyltransferase [Saprospiraceae bacterium]|jgi:glycine hydroxymethyltransferase|nr:serine hydroxymethyltransferase [Saprospiraceae bacterium]MBV6474102.1 Serine hydroxymethyltransferase [Saprospiraceae bacterium]